MKLPSVFCFPLVLLSSALGTEPVPYDPLVVAETKIVTETLEVKDAARNRVLPLRVYLPESKTPAPVILFSHGLGGSRDNNPYLGNHWAKRGYLVVFVQHPGSDESVWRDLPPSERMAAMKGAASLANFLERMKDIPLVIDTLTKWNTEEGTNLKGRLDLRHLGMSGHSFGARTTQAVSGQIFRVGGASFLEKRITAAVMMSPSIPKTGSPSEAFGSITIPCLLMTGTNDAGVIDDSTPEQRQQVFPALSQAPAWEIVFDKAEHSSFGQRMKTKGNEESGNRYHKSILALTTAFWDATLRGNSLAKDWLNGNGARTVLEEADHWERNERTK